MLKGLLTGDTHGDMNRLFPYGLGLTEPLGADEYVIVAGDFGNPFYPQGTMANLEQRNDLDAIEKLPYTVLFVDGNHENFELLYKYPTEMWNGGRIHRLRKNVIHLMRGQVYDIDGTKVFTMGGGYSRDKYMRTEGISWWPQEMPNNSEYREATQNLREAGNKVDYIITHTAPTKAVYRLGLARGTGKHLDEHESELNGFFDWVSENVEFKKWFFGHWHQDIDCECYRAVYFDTVRLGEN